MVKRKQVKDGDVAMEGADPAVEGDQSDEVCRSDAHLKMMSMLTNAWSVGERDCERRL